MSERIPTETGAHAIGDAETAGIRYNSETSGPEW